MKKAFLILLFIFLFFFRFSVSAQTPAPRFAVCDLCGYCPPNQPPSSWEACRKCVYPDANSDPQTKDTLKISDPVVNSPPTPYPGRQYTMLGCVGTNLGGFQQQGAAASVVQIILNIIFSIVGGIALLSLLYGVFIIMTSQNNPERLNFGKRIVYGAIVGVIFTLSSVFIINLLASGILKIPGFGQ